MTTVLLLGSGGRKRALGRALVADLSVQLHATPENPGLAGIRALHTADPSDPAAVVALIRRVGANLVVVGPKTPLVAGVTDTVQKAGIDCFGPSATTAELEGSKTFAKDVVRAAGVPAASTRVYATPGEAAATLDAYDPPYAVKNNSLAVGKGVVVTPDRAATLAHAKAYEKVVIEEFLDGPELSLLAIYDGVTAVPLLPAQDFKRVGDDNAGPNTGGVGAYCPLPWAPDGLVEEVVTQVTAPTLTEMRRRGMPFTGLLYAGLASTIRGMRVVEFNVRFGDPETQAVLTLLGAPLAGALRATSRGGLAGLPPLRWHNGATVVVVEAAQGYPGTPVGEENTDLPADTNHAWAMHAGTKATDGRLIVSRGRMLGIIGLGEDLDQARGRAYEHLLRMDFPNGFHRTGTGIPH